MKFLIDAQLPRRLVGWIQVFECEAQHIQDLPDGNRTSDAEIIHRADQEGWIVVTKDADFVDSHILHGRPAKLLLISTGNLTNRELQDLLSPLLPRLILEFQNSAFLEIDRKGLTIRG